MNVLLITSIIIRIVGLGWSLRLWWRVRDWRMGFLAAMFLLMGLRQSGTLVQETAERAAYGSHDEWGLPEIPGLLVSVLGLLAVVYLERLLMEQKRQEESLRENSERYRQMTQTQKALFNELDHRVRNNLAGLLTLVKMGCHSAADVQVFSESLANRIMAMKSVHELIAGSQWRGADLRALLETLSNQIVSSGDARRRISFDGPTVPVRSRHASALAMMLQELLTNSHKHGALGTAAGTVAVRWEITSETDPAVIIGLSWQETAVLTSKPVGGGMGLELIRGFARSDFRGECEFVFDPAGFRCNLKLTIEKGANQLNDAAQPSQMNSAA